ncbi:MAG: sigma-70 family RNA polymerase sigma factor [Moorea sp. SIO2B7]|nr:sigma-70 family RNA polymerase sigma factor [Moorena sp. SIO2B7]
MNVNKIVLDPEKLHQLVADTCKHPPGSLKRQQNLTKLILLIEQSKKLWQESTLYYEDALQQTWIYLCENLCEAGTTEKYDPNRSSVITWLNRYLKWRLHNFRLENQAEKRRKITGKISELDQISDPIENLEASPDIPPILENIRIWAETDLEGELGSIHIKNQIKVTAQVLILRRLPPETSWKQLSREFGISVSTLSNFYQRQCMPRLRNFGKSEGYLYIEDKK